MNFLPYLIQKGQFWRLYEFKNTLHLELNKIRSKSIRHIGSGLVLILPKCGTNISRYDGHPGKGGNPGKVH